MKHHRYTIRIWLTAALTTAASLALVSTASAMRNATDPGNYGYGRGEPSSVVSSSSGFNWGIAATAAALIVTAVVVARMTSTATIA
jgi:hypothetical protein